MKVTVLVPTHRRTTELRRCLCALQSQGRPADELIVTVRDTDDETRAFFAGFDPGALPLRLVEVSEPGVVAAMNAGVDAAQGDIVALTDDDAAPFPDWLERLEGHFAADEGLGGVGGRDRVLTGPDAGRVDQPDQVVVGKVQWFGRVIGNHHLGIGAAREVDELKGVNCAYRVALLRRTGFDTRLRGGGAQVHWELSLGLAARQEGWRLLYDPSILVDHFPAIRLDEDQRDSFSAAARKNATHNETLVLLDHLPPARRFVFLVWALCIGTRTQPGIAQAIRLFLLREDNVIPCWAATLAGRGAGLASYLKRVPRTVQPKLANSKPQGVKAG